MLRRACRWQILPALLLGATTTVLIAWLLVCLPEKSSNSHYFIADGPIQTPDGPDNTSELTASRTRESAQYESIPRGTSVSRFGFATFVKQSQIAPPWVLVQLAIPKDSAIQFCFVTTQGWPYRSLWSKHSFSISRDSNGLLAAGIDHHGELRLPGSWAQRIHLTDHDAFCYYPIPCGFAMNTALFAPAWWLLLFLPPTTRRYVRRRRDLCPACAYDRQGLAPSSPCPECGAT